MARNSEEVLSATAQWIRALMALDERGIRLGNITYSTLLLPSTPRDQATIIDLGLTRVNLKFKRKEPNPVSDPISSGLSESSSLIIRPQNEPIDHLWGALPFIAYDILRKPVDHAKSFLKVLHHDLESVFWTLYYFALYHGGPDVDKTHQVNWACPSSISASTVTNLKAALLLDRRRWEGDIGGLFGSLKPYFQAFTNQQLQKYV